MLSVVATPIGNMSDITLRAIDVLRSCDIVAAEDTRHTRNLLRHYQIDKQLVAFHEHNARSKTPQLVQLLKAGKHIALTSDAGTPGISDPGYVLIKAAIDNQIPVVPVPGVSAVITGLMASGLPTESFVFVGFLPKKEKKRRDLLGSFLQESRTVVCYESPYRIIRTLEEIAKLIPGKEICLGRELTKKFEEFIRGTPLEVLEEVRNRKVLGEITLVIGRGRAG